MVFWVAEKAGKAVRAAVIFLIFSLFSACGELDSLFSSFSSESYPVKVLVNDNFLEECSILRPEDTIRPYFDSSVADDPDLTGLLVYLQNTRGEIAGKVIGYELDANFVQPSFLIDETDELIPAVKGKWSFFSSKTETRDADEVKKVKSFGQKMPHFSISADIETGVYSLVFEAMGRKGELLSQSTVDVFYLGKAKFEPNNITVYLPDISSSQMIPSSTTVILETNLEYDSNLDPYVIWYNGKNVISEGRIKDGAGSILWTAPEQSGFYSVRLEIFPFRLDQNIVGFPLEIALPVSSKIENTGYFFEDGPSFTAQIPLAAGNASFEPLTESSTESSRDEVFPAPKLLRWYQFRGNLSDTVSSEDLTLETLEDKSPRWMSLGGHYGLTTGPDDAYVISLNFLSDKQELSASGGGILLFHVKPLTEDTILSVSFPYLSSSDGVLMDVARKENSIVLRLSSGVSVKEIVIHDFIEPETLIPVAVEFYIRPDRLEAKLSLGYYPQSRTGSINLLYPLSGEGKIMLGGTPATTPASTIPTASIAATIWNEFAVLLSEVPVIREEPLPEIIEPAAEKEVIKAEVIKAEVIKAEVIKAEVIKAEVIKTETVIEHHVISLSEDLVTDLSDPETPKPSDDTQIIDTIIQNDFGEEKKLIYNGDKVPEQAAE